MNWYRRGATLRLGGAAVIGTLLLLGLGGWPALLTLAVAIGVVALVTASAARRRKSHR